MLFNVCEVLLCSFADRKNGRVLDVALRTKANVVLRAPTTHCTYFSMPPPPPNPPRACPACPALERNDTGRWTSVVPWCPVSTVESPVSLHRCGDAGAVADAQKEPSHARSTVPPRPSSWDQLQGLGGQIGV